MAIRYVSAAAYTRRVLTNPDEVGPVILRQALDFVATLAESWKGRSILMSIDIDDGWHFNDGIRLADVVVDLNDRPETVHQLAESLRAGELAYLVAPWVANNDSSVLEPAIWVTSTPGGYVIAHISRHPRLGCLRVQIC